jgi:hypothetical protein
MAMAHIQQLLPTQFSILKDCQSNLLTLVKFTLGLVCKVLALDQYLIFFVRKQAQDLT